MDGKTVGFVALKIVFMNETKNCEWKTKETVQ
jgi:hypothetical protein